MSDAPRHLHWGAEALWQRLEPLLPGLSVEVTARTDSTNTRLLERARVLAGQRDAPISRPGDLEAGRGGEATPHGRRSADLAPCLLVAEHQTAGRGRQGRGWLAQPGASLTMSLALPLAPASWSGLSLAVGLALAEALDPWPEAGGPPASGPSIGLKWPNDLWLRDGHDGGRKLGGILIETVNVGQRRMCVIGIGLNILPLAPEGAAGLAHGHACLQELQPDTSAPQALHQLAEPLVRALRRFEAEGFAPLQAAYARRDLLAGQAVTTTHPDLPGGIALGVDALGGLRLAQPDGGERVLASGEVSVRLREGG